MWQEQLQELLGVEYLLECADDFYYKDYGVGMKTKHTEACYLSKKTLNKIRYELKKRGKFENQHIN